MKRVSQRTTDGKRRTYTNLAVFNSTCSKRGWRGPRCALENLRCTKKYVAGVGGLATIRVEGRGTWLLSFADCNVLKDHLRGRVEDPRGFLPEKPRRRR